MTNSDRPVRLSDALGVRRCAEPDCIALVPRGLERCPLHEGSS